MLLSEAWRSLTANLSTTFAATITVLIGMALVGMLVGFGTYARSWTDKTKRELVVHEYEPQSWGPAEAERLVAGTRGWQTR